MSKILLTDKELLVRLSGGSTKAFEMIFKKYYSDLYTFAYSYIMNKEQAEDMVQDTFAKLWSIKKEINGEIPLKNYLFASVRNECYDIFRHLKIEDKHKEKLKESFIFTSQNMLYDELDDDLSLKFDGFVNGLTDQQKRIIEMKYINNKSYKQIAYDMGISENTIHTHIKRAYQTIRKLNLFLNLF